MRTPALLLLLFVLFVAGSALAGGPPLRSKKVDRAVETVQPSVVKIFGVKGFRGVYGYMTGLIVHESGLVITRGSVTLDEAPRIKAHLHDGRRLFLEIVREDRRTKMMLLRLKGDAGEKFPAARLGASKGVKPGQFVLLIGNAYKVALGRERCAVNLGVVGSISKLELRAGLSGKHDYDGVVILHDAMNNPGVFGGPLVNLNGEVIGISGRIVESRETNVQVHYAIPIDVLKPFLADTLQNPDAPKLYDPRRNAPPPEIEKPGYHGIRLLKGGINRATPAYVDRIEKGSPAEKAGVRPDDLVLKLDSMRVKTWRSFRKKIATYQDGETVRLTIKRGNDITVLEMTLSRRPKQ